MTEVEKVECDRLRRRAALLESLLWEAVSCGYIQEKECSPRWLKEVREAVVEYRRKPDEPSGSGAM